MVLKFSIFFVIISDLWICTSRLKPDHQDDCRRVNVYILFILSSHCNFHMY